ncbi:ribonuclease P protein component [soil metagenome]
MLPATARLRRREDFDLVVRRGARAGRGSVVVHLLPGTGPGPGPRVGLVVGRGVGNSVRRHQVSRRLRHVLRDRLPRLAAADRLVVRATPAAAGRSSAELGQDLDAALTRCLGPR